MFPQVEPRKSLGQNFLIDKNIAGKIVELLQVAAEDLILEIGPGFGSLTQFFSDLPAQFFCYEIDSRLVEQLNSRFNSCQNISIIQQDFLTLNFDHLKETGRMIKWIGNMPYNITSPVLFSMIHQHPLVKKAVFMVQREVAERITAKTGTKDYGILSVLLGTFYQVRLEFFVSPHVFRPRPKVESAVISFDICPDYSLNCDHSFYETLVKTAFNQRRKKLKNALQKIIIREKMEQIPFNFDRRAEDVTIEDWKNLCQFLTRRKNHIQAING